MAAPPPAMPPEAVPADQQEDLDKRTKGLSVLLVSKQIPWRVQGEMARQGYITVEDLHGTKSPNAWPRRPRLHGWQPWLHGPALCMHCHEAPSGRRSRQADPGTARLPGGGNTQGTLNRSTPRGAPPSLDRRTLEETYMTPPGIPGQ